MEKSIEENEDNREINQEVDLNSMPQWAEVRSAQFEQQREESKRERQAGESRGSSHTVSAKNFPGAT
jgi:hypothetical protein